MTHTPEPWIWIDDSTEECPAFFSISSEPAGGWGEGGIAYLTLRESEAGANARRIVACVNALSGISTEAIESGAVHGVITAARDLIDYCDSSGTGECLWTVQCLRTALSQLAEASNA